MLRVFQTRESTARDCYLCLVYLSEIYNYISMHHIFMYICDCMWVYVCFCEYTYDKCRILKNLTYRHFIMEVYKILLYVIKMSLNLTLSLTSCVKIIFSPSNQKPFFTHEAKFKLRTWPIFFTLNVSTLYHFIKPRLL